MNSPATLQYSFACEGSGLFLKSLDITGFKSFARSTRFEFTPGITALVGPNGSGKSNVVDAIRWCLGEQSVRDLRGQRAEDVIYAGSRHMLGAAEVALTFSPGAGEAATHGDVTIARRLYRSGESEYLIDGRKARLRDLSDRLRELGIDGSRHIVVTQGMADALLSAAPMDRRALLEQAAGLSGYRVRRDEARQKLATTEQNIATIGLVLEELEPRLRSLRRQVRAVQDRAEAQALLRRRLQDWYARQWHTIHLQFDDLRAKTERVEAQRRAAETRQSEMEHATEAALQRDREWQQRLDALVAGRHVLERDRDVAEGTRTALDQSLISARKQLEGAGARAARARAAAQEAAQRIGELEESVQEAEVATSRLGSEAQRLELEYGRANAAVQSARPRLEVIQRKVHEHERTARAALERSDEVRRQLEQVMRRRAEVERSIASTQASIEEGERDRNVLAAQAREAVLRRDALLEQLRAAEDVASDWRRRATRLDVIVARTRGAATDAQRRRDSAQVSLRTLASSGMRSLVERIDVQRGWETAIAAALGPWAFRSIEDGPNASLHARHDAGFDAWRTTLNGAVQAGVWADTVVTGMPAGRVNPLRTAVLVETEQEAHDVWNRVQALPAFTVGTPPVTVITKEGVCWNAVGREVSGGEDRAASYLRLKREVETMTARCAILSKRSDRLQSARASAVTQRKNAEGEVAHVQASVGQQRHLTVELESKLLRLERQHDERAERIKALRVELGGLTTEETSLQSESSRWATSKQEMDAAAGQLRRDLEAKTEQMEAARSLTSRLDAERRDSRHSYEVAVATDRARPQLLARVRAEHMRLGSELAQVRAETEELERTVQRLEHDSVTQRERIARLDELLREHVRRESEVRAARPEREVSGQHLRGARATASDLVRQHERLQSERLGAQRRLDELAVEIMEELGKQPELLVLSQEEPPTEAEVKRLRSRAGQYAEADPSVVEEARELAERHEYLLKHVEDLRTAAETLRTMMQVADAEMRTQFDIAFTAVSEEFSRVFEVMLRGGRARLEQLEGGGLEVVAQLPGKRSRSSAAFSGGERSLIASSLLFGVLKMRPAPFCVLDEVDAALDEGNVDRYLAALHDISRQTQALVVTHNRATMAAADVLYGLTMNPEGTSEVLSLRLDAKAAG